jgi:hypothetical protein
MKTKRFGTTTMKAAAALAAGLAILLAPVAAQADTTAPGTDSATVTAASLAVGTVGAMTALAPVAGGTATGALPTAQLADATGSGSGWNGTAAVSPLSYTRLGRVLWCHRPHDDRSRNLQRDRER